jgi:RNA polymerase sigma-70 factor, ECF subfamily
MTGSVIDGEDVVQEALLKAFEALPRTAPLTNPAGWLFRIASNAALDFLRRRARYQAAHANADVERIADPANLMHERQVTAASLRTFMHLPTTQRSTVILIDVLGYSLAEVHDIVGVSIPAVKSALQRGRARLRELVQEPDECRARLWPSPSARVSSGMSSASTRGTSTRYAPCLPTTSGSTW